MQVHVRTVQDGAKSQHSWARWRQSSGMQQSRAVRSGVGQRVAVWYSEQCYAVLIFYVSLDILVSIV